MPTTIELYRNTARNLANVLANRLVNEVRAVILYGSVARGEATRNSDIDVLILTDHPDRIRLHVAEVEEALDAENGYRTFLASVYLTPEEFQRLIVAGSPFAEAVLEDGIALYDNGFFRQVREHGLATGRRDAVRRKAYAR